ncbi:MAG: TIGR04086 family membrane protein [Clostridiales bacterium]|nr:TIGR04086 family membrane protein [Clostridiales bacterium]
MEGKAIQNKKNILSNFVLKCSITVLRSVAISIALTIVLLLISALILWLFEIPDNVIPLWVQIVRLISILIGAILCAVSVKHKGWLLGGVCGAVYILLSIVIGALFFDEFMLTNILISDIIFAVGVGIIGGIIGVNLNNKKHQKI